MTASTPAAKPEPRSLGMTTLCQLGEREDERRTVSESMALTAGLAADAALRAYHIAARRLALQLLFELDSSPMDSGARAAALDQVDDLGPIMRDRVETLVARAWRSRRSIDALLAELSPEWPPSRQPAVDRAILRLALAELSLGLTPANIAINEAVELASAFSTERSPGFINGVLAKANERLPEIHEEIDPFDG